MQIIILFKLNDVRDRLIKFINSKNVFTVPNTCGFSENIIKMN